MKITAQYGGKEISCMFWGAGGSCEVVTPGMHLDVIGSLQKDEYRGGVYVKGVDWEVRENI